MSRKSDLAFVVRMPRGAHRWRCIVEANEPGRSGYWVFAHVSVAFVSCPLCKAQVGHRCSDPRDGPQLEAHPERRAAYSRQIRDPRELVLDAWGVGKMP
jgi:hypothetical protein